MAILRLPNPVSSFPFENTTLKLSRRTKSNFFGPPFFTSVASRLISSQSRFNSVLIKPRGLGGFATHSSATAQDQVVSSSTNEAERQGGGREAEFSDNRLIAQNVPWSSTPEDIRSLFQKYGNVIDVELSMYNKTRNRGLAFVTMGSPEEAVEALNNLESYEYEGRILKVAYAKLRKENPATRVKPKPVTFNLFVANLPFDARAKHLKEFFSNAVSAEVIFHSNPRRSSGYGFVAFKTKKEADEALAAFEGKEFMGRPIRIARSRQFAKVQSDEGSQSKDLSSKPDESKDEEN